MTGAADPLGSEPLRLHLASGSARRRELLHGLGVPYRALTVTVEEAPRAGETARGFVERMAREKALAGVEALRRTAGAGWSGAVLGADTVVVVDGLILGKPVDRDDAVAQLGRLSGRDHVVMTAVALAWRLPTEGLRVVGRVSRSRVWFRHLRPGEREAYWDSGEPADKAGSYAVQGLAAQFVMRLEGSYSGVVGLPLYETSELLRRAGVAPWGGGRLASPAHSR